MCNTDIRVFAVSRLGASHVKSGKPCQDASLAWQSEDGRFQAIVVADGHGGDTYVRSDVGSRLATELALHHIRRTLEDADFVRLMEGSRGAVTARPDGPRRVPKDPAERSESLLELLRQDKLFARQVAGIREQDERFQQLFRDIYEDWLDNIRRDSEENPFTDSEKALLGEHRLAKAYGTTLMAFVRTPAYWFAFHLGDGKMLAADETGQWSEPVPWDCNCFLNLTTSLCNSRPLSSFRYAFDGTGHFPVAVVLGSDGLDDSWGTMEKLQNFYSQVLSIFWGNEVEGKTMEQTVGELGEYLTRVSVQGSRDDMTMAGLLDWNRLDIPLQLAKLRQQGTALKAERDQRNRELQDLERKAEQEIDEMQKRQAGELEQFRQDWKARIEARRVEVEQENNASRQEFEQLRAEADKLKMELAQVKADVVEETDKEELLTPSEEPVDTTDTTAAGDLCVEEKSEAREIPVTGADEDE